MKENKILISILVPTYNRVKYLKECLDSIIEQEGFDLKELELIVSDNSEGEETKNFMEKYINDNKNWNIQYNKNKKNLGMVGNWNKLLELKKGEYFIFLSDDDKFYDKNSLKIIYNGLLKYKLDVCYGKYMSIDGTGKELGLRSPHNKIINKNLYIDNFNEQINRHSISFGGILYKDFGYKYREYMNMAADWNMNLRYLYNKKSIGIINYYTFCYRDHTNNSIKKTKFKKTLERRLNNYNDFNVRYKFFKLIYFGSIDLLYPYFICNKIGQKVIKISKKILYNR